MSHSEEIFAVGLDGHCSQSFFVSNNTVRFEGSLDVQDYVGYHPNDLVNLMYLRALSELNIDIVFSQSLNQVRTYMKDRMMKLFLFHGQQEDLSESSKIVLSHPDVLSVFLFNGKPKFLEREIPDFPSLYYFPGDWDRCIGFVKPGHVLSLVRYFKMYLEDILA